MSLDLHREFPLPPQPRPRPLMVTAIALFQLLRAALIILACVGPLRGHTVDPIPVSLVQVTTLDALYFFKPYNEDRYITRLPQEETETKFDAAGNLIVAGPVAIFSAYIGFALLFWKPSGRSIALVHSAMILLYWLRGLLFSWAWQDTDTRYFTTPQTKSNIVLALIINACICFYLASGNNVAQAFGEKD